MRALFIDICVEKMLFVCVHFNSKECVQSMENIVNTRYMEHKNCFTIICKRKVCREWLFTFMIFKILKNLSSDVMPVGGWN